MPKEYGDKFNYRAPLVLEPDFNIVEGCWPLELTIGSMVRKPGESTTVESGIFMLHEGKGSWLLLQLISSAFHK